MAGGGGTGGNGGTPGSVPPGGIGTTASNLTGSAAGGLLYTTGSVVNTVGTGLAGAGGTPVAGSALGTVGGVVADTGTGVQNLGTGLSSNGLAGLPVVGSTAGAAVTGVDRVANPLARVTVLNTPIAGGNNPASTSLLGASVLSNTGPGNAVIGVGALSAGRVLQVTTNTGAAPAAVGSAVGNVPVAGPVAASVVSPVVATIAPVAGGVVAPVTSAVAPVVTAPTAPTTGGTTVQAGAGAGVRTNLLGTTTGLVGGATRLVR
ncbi:hypothetical protein [Muricoccus radiodurans]|uniref:hypothetical protein n=1 Tax=Muricoccus radiodurans TaxID=2231721 RepID=UPI003CEAE84D